MIRLIPAIFTFINGVIIVAIFTLLFLKFRELEQRMYELEEMHNTMMEVFLNND